MDGEIISGPDIISRGFVYVRDSEEFLRELNKLAVITINNLKKGNVNSWGILKRGKRSVREVYIYKYKTKADDSSYNNRGLIVKKNSRMGILFVLKTK